MRNYLKDWVDCYFSDDAAVMLGFVLVAGLVIVLTLGRLLAPVLAGFVVSYLLQGAVSCLEKYRVPHLLAVSITFLFFCTSVALVIFMVLPVVWEQLTTLFNELPRMVQQLQELLTYFSQRYPMFFTEYQLNNMNQAIGIQLGQAGQWLLSFSASKLMGVVTVLVYFILVPLLIFFFLKDREKIIVGLQKFIPRNRRLIKQVAAEMNIQIANYIRGKVIEIIIVGVADYILFAWLHLNYAALLAVLVGLSVVIPYIGAVVVTIPVVGIALLQWGWSSEFILLICIYIIIQAIDGNVLVPLLLSEVVNLHPIAVIMAILIFGGLWGFWGVFFAIPLATLIKAVYNVWPKNEMNPQDA